MDKARQRTDKQLKKIQKNIFKVYQNNQQLKKASKKYKAYMDIVKKRTKTEYEAFINESDTKLKSELKNAYISILRELTVNSKDYKKVVKEYARALTAANSEALKQINNKTAQIYADNYNQVAVECRRVGIEVVE